MVLDCQCECGELFTPETIFCADYTDGPIKKDVTFVVCECGRAVDYQLKVVSSYCIANAASINIYTVKHDHDMEMKTIHGKLVKSTVDAVLAGMDNQFPDWFDIEWQDSEADDSEAPGYGHNGYIFSYYGIDYNLNDFIRV